MPLESTPPAEVAIDEALVRSLLRAQHPDIADAPLRAFNSGWDNELYRLGDAHVVRLPRRAVAAVLVEHEQRWLPVLAPRLPLPIPVPERFGVPTADYPWPWSVIPWIGGQSAAVARPSDAHAAADALGRFCAALHHPAPADAPENAVRGVPLADRAESAEARFAALRDAFELDALRRHFDAALAAPMDDGEPLWLHGDLHPHNLLVRDDALAAVIDFGDITSGDRASDLATAWMCFDAEQRAHFRSVAGAERPIDDATWSRARGWAVQLCLTFLHHSADDPVMRNVADHALHELRTDAG